jgi:hypothetical protein
MAAAETPMRREFNRIRDQQGLRRYTRTILSPARATAILDAVGRLERMADMGEVARLACGPSAL